MDVVSHGLWAGAAAKAANKQRVEKVSVLKTAAWGLFPDVFAFGPAFAWLFYLIATGALSFSEFPGVHHVGEPASGNSLPALQLASALYNFSHSIIMFALVFLLAWLIMQRPVWEMGGWLLHIIMDIPTHSYAFFPTPVFWPLFGWKFNGINWATLWFMIFNYSALVLAYWLLREKKKDTHA